MSVVASDIKVKYSVAAAAGNTTAGTAAASLGDQISTTEATGATNMFFDDVSSAEASAGDVEYRCVFVHNTHATDSALNVHAVIASEVSLGATTTVALDNIATSAVGSASAQADVVANENTAPTGVGAYSTDVTIGTLLAGQVKAVWLKRTVTASTAAINGDGFTLRVTGDG